MLWVNGVQKQAVARVDLGTRPLTEARLGAQGVDAGTSGTLYIDNFESRRFSYIGLLPEPDVDIAQPALPTGWAKRQYTYDPAHPHAVSSLGGNTYAYDANGNQTTRVIGADTFTLFYDAENHLVEVKKNGASFAAFLYDGDGKRVQSTINGVNTTFVGNYYEVSGSAVTKYYYAGASRVAMREGGELYFLLGDHLGSTSLTTDAGGGVISEMRYTAWGEVRYQSGSTQSEYTYTGQYSNMSDFGLMFYNARWYDPYLNQFSQPDSIVPDPANPQAWDRYAYSLNNPVRYTDPSGHCIFGLDTVVCIAAVVVVVAGLLTSDVPQSEMHSPPERRISNYNSGYDCTARLSTCHTEGRLSSFEDNQIDEQEFNEFLEKVAGEVDTGLTPPVSDPEDLFSYIPAFLAGRGTYDSPFYNGGGNDLEPLYPGGQQVCIGDLGCWGRSEVNYVLQGMWGADSGETLDETLGVVKFWNEDQYGKSEQEIKGKLYWAEYGYRWYISWHDERK